MRIYRKLTCHIISVSICNDRSAGHCVGVCIGIGAAYACIEAGNSVGVATDSKAQSLKTGNSMLFSVVSYLTAICYDGNFVFFCTVYDLKFTKTLFNNIVLSFRAIIERVRKSVITAVY